MAQSVRVERDATKLKLVAPTESAVKHTISALSGGFRADRADANLSDAEANDLVNLHFTNGELVVRFGVRQFAPAGVANVGTNKTGASYVGQAAATYQLAYADGSFDELLITTGTLYRWAATVLQWQLVSYGQMYVSTGAQVAGDDLFVLNSVAGLVAGQLCGLMLDDGTQLITTITDVFVIGNFVKVLNRIPAGRSSAVGATFSRAAPYNGDLSARNQVVGVTFTVASVGAFIFCNGIDPIQTYSQGLVTQLAGLPNAPTSCRAMCVAHEQLLIANLTENGVSLPTRLRASDQAAPTVWAPGTGIAALYPLDDTPDPILALKTLGVYVIVYRGSNIMRGLYLGLANQTWFWEYTVTTEGVVSQGAVVDTGSEHVLVGHAGVYTYTGGLTLDDIGDAVFQDFLAPQGDINVDQQATLFVAYSPVFDEVWIVYPVARGTPFPIRYLCVELENNAWFRGQFGEQFVSAATAFTVASVTWSTIVGTWSQQGGQWNSQVIRSNVPNIMLCPINGAPVKVFDYAAVTDDSVPIPWSIETKQFGDGRLYTRWDYIDFYAFDGGAGTTAVSFSTDETRTWTLIGTVGPFGVNGSVKRLWPDVTTLHFQLKLVGNDPAFSLRGADINGVLDSEW